MKFLDANILVYAYFQTKRNLEEHEENLKENSRKIIEKIEKGEEVTTSTTHLSEAANVLASTFTQEDLADLLLAFTNKPNVTVLDTTRSDFIASCMIAKQKGVKVNDCLALHLMKKEKIKEIYTFDKHFEEFEDIEKIPE